MRCGYYICFTLMLFSSLSLRVSGQQTLTIHGVASKKLSAERVSQVLIINLRSKDVMMSDEVGWFTVKAAIGDTLLFSKVDYTDQKIVITNGSDLPVYMQPVIHLATVNVQGESKKQELSDVMKDYNRKGIYYNGNPPLASLILNPLNDLHLLFGKDAADLRRFKAFSKDELEYTEIRRRYNLKLVKQVTNAPDSTAIKFMEYYTPSYQDLKGWNDYDLINQIKKSYEYYNENKDSLDLQHLNAPALQKTDELQKP